MASRTPIAVTVVIPAYNEERAIGPVLERLRQAAQTVVARHAEVAEVEIIVVDDASRDRTAEVAAAVAGVKVVRLPANRGYGGALLAGFAAARGEWLAFLDADGTYPPEFIADLVAAMLDTDADIVLGSRFAGAASQMPLVRRVGNVFFARLLSWLTGRSITDTASGMRIFKRSVLEQLRPLPAGLHFTPAMSTAALHQRLDIREIPMPYDQRVGASKLNPVVDGLRFLAIILGTAHRYNPLKIFGALGALLLAVGIGFGVGPVAYYLSVQRVEDWAIYRLLAVLVAVVSGINLIFFGAVANVVLAATHRLPPFRNSVLGRLLLRPALLRQCWLLGVLLMLAALALDWSGIYSYLTTGLVFSHWSYVVTGALLFLLGLSFALWGSLVRTVLEVVDRAARREAEEPAAPERS
ncbi:MAG: glycosyltransferase family 2 protein [Deltaproteobacteria bacterium]|nr:glycosyltransferase family 2 protein [Deltaproteobacteria bacterium]